MKEISCRKDQEHLYNYIIVGGWVIVLLDNKPVNYYADHGMLYCVNKPFKFLCEQLNMDIVDIIVLIQEIKKS